MPQEKRQKRKRSLETANTSAARPSVSSTRLSFAYLLGLFALVAVLLLGCDLAFNSEFHEDASTISVADTIRQNHRRSIMFRVSGERRHEFIAEFVSRIEQDPEQNFRIVPQQLADESGGHILQVLHEHRAVLALPRLVNLSADPNFKNSFKEIAEKDPSFLGKFHDPFGLVERFWSQHRSTVSNLIRRQRSQRADSDVYEVSVSSTFLKRQGTQRVLSTFELLLEDSRAIVPSVSVAWVSQLRDEIDRSNSNQRVSTILIIVSLFAASLATYFFFRSFVLLCYQFTVLAIALPVAVLSGKYLFGIALGGELGTLQVIVASVSTTLVGYYCITAALCGAQLDGSNCPKRSRSKVVLALLLLAVPVVAWSSVSVQTLPSDSGNTLGCLTLLGAAIAIGCFNLLLKKTTLLDAQGADRVLDRARSIYLFFQRKPARNVIVGIGLVIAVLLVGLHRLNTLGVQPFLASQSTSIVRDKEILQSGDELGLPEAYVYYYADNQNRAIDMAKSLAPILRKQVSKGWVSYAAIFSELFPSSIEQRSFQRALRTLLKTERSTMNAVFIKNGLAIDGLEDLYNAIRSKSSDLLLPEDFVDTELGGYFEQVLHPFGNGVVVSIPLYGVTSAGSIAEELPGGYQLLDMTTYASNLLPIGSVGQVIPALMAVVFAALIAFSAGIQVYASVLVIGIAVTLGLGLSLVPGDNNGYWLSGFLLGVASLLPTLPLMNGQFLRSGWFLLSCAANGLVFLFAIVPGLFSQEELSHHMVNGMTVGGLLQMGAFLSVTAITSRRR